jgi:hypothetical protein
MDIVLFPSATLFAKRHVCYVIVSSLREERPLRSYRLRASVKVDKKWQAALFYQQDYFGDIKQHQFCTWLNYPLLSQEKISSSLGYAFQYANADASSLSFSKLGPFSLKMVYKHAWVKADVPYLFVAKGNASQIAVGGEREKWFTDAAEDIRQKFPAIEALLFFNVHNDNTTSYKSLDWSIDSDTNCVNLLSEAYRNLCW